MERIYVVRPWRPRHWREFPDFPTTTATIAVSTLVTIAAWSGKSISFLYADPHVGRGEIWRLVTSALPHGGVLHLVFNVYWLWVFGTIVESVFGSLATAGIYVLFALASGAAQYALSGSGIGLSGVGYGLFGFLWAARRDPRFFGAIEPRVVSLFAGWFVICIVLTNTGAMNVGNVAHGAGAIVGALTGFTLARRGVLRALAWTGLALLLVASLAGATVLRAKVNLSRSRGLAEFELGYDALEANQNAEAARWFEEAAALAPRDHASWYDLGIAYERLGRHDDARRAFATAAAIPHRMEADVQDELVR